LSWRAGLARAAIEKIVVDRIIIEKIVIEKIRGRARTASRVFFIGLTSRRIFWDRERF
jgi:hypothetical protein